MLRRLVICIACLAVVTCIGCGGKIAKPGRGRVTSIDCNGVLCVQYADGKWKWKRLHPDSGKEERLTVWKNLYQPAKLVETKEGSTITFPCGDTVKYYNITCDDENEECPK